jgi:hypothetical protein
MSIGRNDPCPCGSGRKYKKCHQAADTAPAASAAHDVTSPLHEMDNRLVVEMTSYASKRFPEEFLEEAENLATHPEMSPQFAAPWLVYVAEIQGRPVVDWYVEERGWSLSNPVLAWLAAQQKSWVSIWEIVDVDPGRALVLRDLLTAERRTVHEVSASKTAQLHYAVLGRVVDAGSVSLICGMHTIPLRPRPSAEAVAAVRRALRRRTAVSQDRLRETKIVWKMLHAWSDEIERLHAPPTLVNTDGDPLLLTQDRWSFGRANRLEIIAGIESIEGAEAEESESCDVFTILREGNRQHKDWDNTIVGRIEIRDEVVVADTNSIARADALRSRIEEVCPGLLRRGTRSHTDPSPGSDAGAREPVPLPQRLPTPEEQAIVLQMKESHYAQWLHDSIPALVGATPREAAGTKSGREKLEILMKEIELIESREPESARYDVRKLCRALGLPVK